MEVTASMVERAGNPSGGNRRPVDANRVETTPSKSVDGARSVPGSVDESAAPLQKPNAPKSAVEGAYHQRSLASTGESSLVSIRMAQPDRAFTHEGGRRFAALLDTVRQPGPDRVRSANQAFDTLLNYLDQRTDHANQTGSLHAELNATPTEERVPLLRRSIHVLRKAVRDGVLPASNLTDLKRLSRTSQGMGWNFDLDDNIASLDTQIILFDKSTGQERGVSTTEFAEIREHIGRSGAYANFEIRDSDPAQGSFRNFRDNRDPAVFSRDLDRAMQSGDWKGPSWSAFEQAMSSPQTAQWSTIITARGHFPNTIHAGLVGLVQRGLLKHAPPRENVFPVGLPGLVFGGETVAPSEAKVKVMETYLDRLQAAPFGPSAQKVIGPDGGRGRRFMHLWGFSDDDYGTFKKTVSILGEQVKQGRWPDVKITVFFTGKDHPEAEPHAVVLKSDGTSRRRLPEETHEVDRALTAIHRRQQAQASLDR